MKFTGKDPLSASRIESMLAHVSSFYIFNTVFFFGLTVLMLYTLYAANWSWDGLLTLAVITYAFAVLIKIMLHAPFLKSKPKMEEQELLLSVLNVTVTCVLLAVLMRYEITTQSVILLYSFIPSLLWLLIYPVAIKRPERDRERGFHGFYGFLEWALVLVVLAWSAQCTYRLVQLELWTALASNLLILSAPFVVKTVRGRHLSKMSQRLQDEIYRDPLTGLHNRRAFYDYYDSVREMARASRRPGSRISPDLQLVLIFADIDFFKKFNDHYGHDAGDECLKMVADFLTENFSSLGLHPYRIGGEEFVLCGTCEYEQLESVLSSEILQAWAAQQMLLPIKHSVSDFQAVTLSGGLVSVGAESIYSSNAAGVTKLADNLLYESKKSRNRLTISPALCSSVAYGLKDVANG